MRQIAVTAVCQRFAAHGFPPDTEEPCFVVSFFFFGAADLSTGAHGSASVFFAFAGAHGLPAAHGFDAACLDFFGAHGFPAAQGFVAA